MLNIPRFIGARRLLPVALLFLIACQSEQAPQPESPTPAKPSVVQPIKKAPQPTPAAAAQPKTEAASEPAPDDAPPTLEASAAQAPPSTESALSVLDATLATGVENRVPTGKGTAFTTGDKKLWAWLKVANATKEATSITMSWQKDGETKNEAKLDIGAGKSWRTWSYMTIGAKQVGTWTVEINDAEGNLIHTLPFTVTEADKDNVRNSDGTKVPPKTLE